MFIIDKVRECRHTKKNLAQVTFFASHFSYINNKYEGVKGILISGDLFLMPF